MGIAFTFKEYIDNKIKDLQQQIRTFERKPCLAIFLLMATMILVVYI